MRICIDDCGIILCDYKRVILWFDLLERLVDLDCNNVILIWTQNILQFGWGIDRRLLKQNYNESLAMSLLEITCSSRSSCVLRVLDVFFVFEGLWWKFFGALEAWIRRASLICDLWCFWRLLSLILVNFEMIWIIPLRMFFVFEGLWWKFFGALEAWILRASLIEVSGGFWAWF